MDNPFNPADGSGSYSGLLKRLTQRVQRAQVQRRILEIIQDSFDGELAEEKIVLSRPEVARLARQVTRAVLADMIAGIDAQRSDKLPL